LSDLITQQLIEKKSFGQDVSQLSEMFIEIKQPLSISTRFEANHTHRTPEQAIKAKRMLQQFIDESFDSNRRIQQIRIKLILWVVRNKLAGILKRGIDLLVCLLLVPIALPVMIITGILIKLDSPGPIFYKQIRVGRWGKTFYCYKFRSMSIDADKRKDELMQLNEADEIIFKMKKDPRITRVGRYIRKYSIDELPQIINIIKGEMSFVGPRPPVPYEVENYQYDHLRRLDVTPGITGLQQVSGRSDLSFRRWVELDLQYIEEQSLAKDIEILLRTIPAVITGRGAY